MLEEIKDLINQTDGRIEDVYLELKDAIIDLKKACDEPVSKKEISVKVIEITGRLENCQSMLKEL